MIKKKIKIFVFLMMIFLVTLTAQENQQPSESEIEKLEQEANSNQNQLIDKALQDYICVIESSRAHIFNPHITSYGADSQILSGLYEGLFTYHPVTLEPQYALAIDYKVSRDKKRITFILRQNAYFSNGEQITAESVRSSWLKLLANPYAPYSSLLDIIRGAQEYRTGVGKAEDVGIYAISDFELSVYLNTPANYFPKVLCHSTFAVVHDNPAVFSGPYVIKYADEASVGLQKNPYYWDSEHTYLKGIVFLQSEDAVENTFTYNSGVASWIIDANVVFDKIMDKEAIQMSAEFGTTYFFFKTSKRKPEKARKEFNPWDYEEFRNAVLEVIPWKELRNNLYIPAKTFVFPLNEYPIIEGFDYTDYIEGKNKMELAKQKYSIPDDTRFTLTLEISQGSVTNEILESIKNSLNVIGVDLVVRQLPVFEYLAKVRESDADMFSYSWIGDFADPLAFLTLFQSDSTLNDSGWENEEFDLLLKKAAVVSDTERYNILAQAETVLLDSGMVIPINHPVAFNIIDTKEIGGWANNAFNIHPLKYLYKKSTKSTVPNIVKGY